MVTLENLDRRDKNLIPVPVAVIRNEDVAIVEELKAGGFVHGDVREPNLILLDEPSVDGRRIQLVDFDRAGKAGEARYPWQLSDVIRRMAEGGGWG